MNKSFTAIAFALLLSTAVTKAEMKPAFTWLYFSTINMNKSYENKNLEKVSIKTNETNLTPSAKFFYTQDVHNPLIAVGETMPDDKLYNRISMVGAASEKNTQKCPYILISMEENINPTQLQVLGLGNGANVFQPAELVLGFSSTGTEDENFDNWDSETLEFEIAINNKLEFNIPTGTKHIIIIAKEEFGGWNIGLSATADIYAIRLFTDKKIVGINETVNEKLGLTVNEKLLTSDEIASFEVYTITGIKVKEEKNTTEINLSNLKAGAYIVKAKSKTGKEELLKVFSR